MLINYTKWFYNKTLLFYVQIYKLRVNETYNWETIRPTITYTAVFRASKGVERSIFLEFLKVKIELCVLNEVSNLIWRNTHWRQTDDMVGVSRTTLCSVNKNSIFPHIVHTHSHVVRLKYVKLESSSVKRNTNYAHDKSMDVATGLFLCWQDCTTKNQR